MSIYKQFDSFELLYFLKLNTIKNNIDGFIYLFIYRSIYIHKRWLLDL